ncbi:hypothetical protein HPB48_006617 [Haemaphysalis longicornis]|uniref:Uncharacterized protein n=1 Tax=Haemaphysalis longicornis TaxID=44386 RepID=A0A9J6GQM2_HAELO|nr:hypothetical protein HPB48_006617 [Haemaphysalis longicornis]
MSVIKTHVKNKSRIVSPGIRSQPGDHQRYRVQGTRKELSRPRLRSWKRQLHQRMKHPCAYKSRYTQFLYWRGNTRCGLRPVDAFEHEYLSFSRDVRGKRRPNTASEVAIINRDRKSGPKGKKEYRRVLDCRALPVLSGQVRSIDCQPVFLLRFQPLLVASEPENSVRPVSCFGAHSRSVFLHRLVSRAPSPPHLENVSCNRRLLLSAKEMSRGFGSRGSGLQRGLDGFSLLRVTEQTNTHARSLQSPVTQRPIPPPLLLKDVGCVSMYLNITAAQRVKILKLEEHASTYADSCSAGHDSNEENAPNLKRGVPLKGHFRYSGSGVIIVLGPIVSMKATVAAAGKLFPVSG